MLTSPPFCVGVCTCPRLLHVPGMPLFSELLVLLDFFLPPPFLVLFTCFGQTLWFQPLPALVTVCLINHCTEPALPAASVFGSKTFPPVSGTGPDTSGISVSSQPY